jgi:hypothetical protein
MAEQLVFSGTAWWLPTNRKGALDVRHLARR